MERSDDKEFDANVADLVKMIGEASIHDSESHEAAGPSFSTTDTDTDSKSSDIPKESLRDFKKRMRKNLYKRGSKMDHVPDVYEKAATFGPAVRKQTGLIFDESMLNHQCQWDEEYPECPERYLCIMERFEELGLISRCKVLEGVKAELSDIERVHPPETIELLKTISSVTDVNEQERHASKYDAIYFDKDTYETALMASGCVTKLVTAICTNQIQNGFALVRPPGHHAMTSEFCGYCFFNNVAIAAKHALVNKLAKKILIVDFDVHHGQATQYTFYEDSRVLYFSIHRYENGTFWPNLRESDCDYVGGGKAAGYNVNVPLNQIGLEDGDYMSIVHALLLPLAYEGCMEITPGFYGHLITALSGLAQGKMAVCLEGGYFLPSLSEAAAMTLKALLGDPVTMLLPQGLPKESVVNTINNVRYYLRFQWKCFRYPIFSDDESQPIYTPQLKYEGEPLAAPFATRECYPRNHDNDVKNFTYAVELLSALYESLNIGQKVAYAYDEAVLGHKPPPGKEYPETPERIKEAYQKFKEFNLHERCTRLDLKTTHISWLEKVHNRAYLHKVFKRDIEVTGDIYTNELTWKSIVKSIDCVMAVMDGVISGHYTSGVAIIRPPGHHAEYGNAEGFCFVNNICVGANYAIEHHELKRILIIDFDIHHGNGTQHFFYDSSKVLYISIHRYDHGKFYPCSEDANYNFVGQGEGKGYNVNIPFNVDKVGNLEYLEVFYKIILPISYSFAPELVMVSAGFDAGVNDPLGGYKLTPEVFGHFIQLLKPLAGGKIVLLTEGGYNAATVAYSLSMCIKPLLGDPLPELDFRVYVKKAVQKTIENVINEQKKYWPVLNLYKRLPELVPDLEIAIDNLSLHTGPYLRSSARNSGNQENLPATDLKYAQGTTASSSGKDVTPQSSQSGKQG